MILCRPRRIVRARPGPVGQTEGRFDFHIARVRKLGAVQLGGALAIHAFAELEPACREQRKTNMHAELSQGIEAGLALCSSMQATQNDLQQPEDVPSALRKGSCAFSVHAWLK